MCYDIKAGLNAQLARARRHGDEAAIREIEKNLLPLTDLPLFHASGFQHPVLLIYPDSSPRFPIPASWGLVPPWVRDREQMKKIYNNTLNARGETLFEKPAFREAARNGRCLICLDGFYEHHHHKAATYPFYIYRRDRKPMNLAGLWHEWTDPDTGQIRNTFAIVTTEGNPLMSRIHNNPKLEGPRMPVILPDEMEDQWLSPLKDELDLKALQELMIPYEADALQSHPVRRLRGKEYPGNVEAISEPVQYADLNWN